MRRHPFGLEREAVFAEANSLPERNAGRVGGQDVAPEPRCVGPGVLPEPLEGLRADPLPPKVRTDEEVSQVDMLRVASKEGVSSDVW